MSIARILIITLLISTSIVMLALFKLESDSADSEVAEPVAPTPTQSENKPTTEPTPPPEFSEGEELLAPDEMVEDAEDTEFEKTQIAEAMAQLNSTNDEERIEAVEQLGAYPNPETEATLGQLLTADANAEVRNAAALSLGSLDEPSDATVASLLSALGDPNEDVRFSALSTLEDFMLGQEEGSKNYQRIHDGLSNKAASSGLPQDLRDSINEILRDPQEMATPDIEPEN